MSYHLIKKNNADDLNMEVNDYLRRGWKLHGETTVTTNIHGLTTYYQAVTKEDE
jgi:hypothetical protein